MNGADESGARPASRPASTTRRQAALRLFVALWPDPRIRQQLAACRDRTSWPPAAAPVATEKLHLTLHFIGSVPAVRVAELAAALQVPIEAFELRLGVVECWRGGLAVLRPRSAPRCLLRLHADLAAVLRQQGLVVEDRAFHPHVTLARRAPAVQPATPAEPVRWRVSGHALVQTMADGGYKVLRDYR